MQLPHDAEAMSPANPTDIDRLVSALTNFPWREHPASGSQPLASGAVTLGMAACVVWKSHSYRSVTFRRDPICDPIFLLEINGLVGELDDGSLASKDCALDALSLGEAEFDRMIPRPEAATVRFIARCLEEGDVHDGRDVDGTDFVIDFLSNQQH